MCVCVYTFIFFFFNDTATTEIYTLSLHDALPICGASKASSAGSTPGVSFDKPAVEGDDTTAASWSAYGVGTVVDPPAPFILARPTFPVDRKSTRLNSSHANISYAVFCLKKKKKYKFFFFFLKSKEWLQVTCHSAINRCDFLPSKLRKALTKLPERLQPTN